MRVLAVPRSIARSLEKSPRMESRIIARRPALPPPESPWARPELLAETSAGGNANLSGAAGLQSRGSPASLHPPSGHAAFPPQVLPFDRRQDPVRRAGGSLRRLGGGGDRRRAGRCRGARPRREDHPPPTSTRHPP